MPNPINWSYVFANLDFMRNKTIYFTIIAFVTLFIVLLIFARRKDRKDLEKVTLILTLLKMLYPVLVGCDTDDRQSLD